MSQEHVEVVRAVYEAINRLDLDTTPQGLSSDCEIDMSRALWPPFRRVYSVDEFRAVQREIVGAWESARWEVDECIDKDPHVVAQVTGRFKGRDGVEVEAEMTWLFTFGGGEIQRITLYQEQAEALEAAGLSE